MFLVKQTVDLSYLGEEWKGCEIVFQSATYRQVKEMAADPDKATENAIDLLKELFVSGKGYNGKEVADMKADDLEDLPLVIISKCLEQIAGKVDPKEGEN